MEKRKRDLGLYQQKRRSTRCGRNIDLILSSVEMTKKITRFRECEIRQTSGDASRVLNQTCQLERLFLHVRTSFESCEFLLRFSNPSVQHLYVST